MSAAVEAGLLVLVIMIQLKCDFLFCCRGPGLGFRTSAEVEMTADVFALCESEQEQKKKGKLREKSWDG